MRPRRWKRLDLRWLAAVAGLLIGFMPMLAAQAQSAPLLQAIPEVANVPVGNQVLFRLEVTDGVDVNAFDVSIAYDEEKLELTSWEYGAYLSNLSAVYEEEQTGFFRLAATQLATPPVSGGGVLLVLFFTAKAPGTAVVDITEAMFADPVGNLSYPECLSGEVTVTNDPTYTATSTLTPTITSTPTRTHTASPTSTRTPTPTRTLTPTPLHASVVVNRTATPTVPQRATGTTQPTNTSAAFLTLTPLPAPLTGEESPTPQMSPEAQNTSIHPALTAMIPATGEELTGGVWSQLICVFTILLIIALIVLLSILLRRRKKEPPTGGN